MRNDFSEWKYYDEFWKEEGEKAFKAYVEKQEEGNQWYVSSAMLKKCKT